jgi:holliday junction DNA helicase RuvB
MTEHIASDVGDVAPSSLAHLVGQQSVVAQVEVGMEAAWADRRKFDHALLVGPPGLGKTQVAQIIAQEMATKLLTVLGQSITCPADLNALLLEAEAKDVVHIDEAHELQKPFQTALYLAVDQKRLFLQGGRSGRSPQSFPVADFTLLLSTTDEYRLLQPLRDRMKLLLRFEFYSTEELTLILRHRSKCLGWEVEEAVLPLVAKRSRGTPRLALRLLQSSRRVCRAQGKTKITLDHLNTACSLEEIDSLGLGPVEQGYLRILTEGATRLNVIASLLSLPARTVSVVVEAFLIRAGLVVKDDQGRRQLTPNGRHHLEHSERRAAK